MRNKLISVITLSLILTPFIIFAQENNLVEMTDFFPKKIAVSGFILTSSQEISIEASALTSNRSRRSLPFSDAWILNSETRDLVWLLSEEDDNDRSGTTLTYANKITLDAGKYEVYYSSFPNYFDNNWYGFRNGFWNRIFGGSFYNDDYDVRRRDYRDLYLRISGSGETSTADDVAQWQNSIKEKSIVDYTSVRDERINETIMKVTSPVTIKIYAIGESLRDGEYDYGWKIGRASCRERV